jgi:hypothetical protein
VNQAVKELEAIENANYSIDKDFELDAVFPHTFKALD